jgi:hypothetical protein
MPPVTPLGPTTRCSCAAAGQAQHRLATTKVVLTTASIARAPCRLVEVSTRLGHSKSRANDLRATWASKLAENSPTTFTRVVKCEHRLPASCGLGLAL